MWRLLFCVQNINKSLEANDSNGLYLDENHVVSRGNDWIQTRSPKLFVRACYDPIYNLAVGQEGAEGAFVIGSPGVGKSCFLDYALYRLQEENNSVLYLSGPLRKAYVYLPNGEVAEFSLEDALSQNMAENVNFVLYDPHETASNTDDVNVNDFKKKKFIVAMYPDEDNWKKLRKDARTAFDLYMGPTSIEESEAMRSVCYPDITQAVVHGRFAKLGGIPRDLFKGVIGGRDKHLEKRLGIQTKALEDASKDPRRIDTGEVTSHFKGLWSLYHLQPDKDTTTGDVDYLSFTIDLCCEDVRARLRDELMKKSVRDLWFAYESTDLRLGTLRGIRYEAYAHKKITSQGVQGVAVSLTKSGTGATTRNVNIPAAQRVVSLPDNNLGAPLTAAFAASDGQQGGSYLLPHLSNFPVMDALHVPGGGGRGLLLQMKAGRSKPLAGESATALYAVSGGGDIVFVVPDEMILRRKLDFSGRAPGPPTMRHFRIVLNEN
jgi:hypothetical protein